MPETLLGKVATALALPPGARHAVAAALDAAAGRYVLDRAIFDALRRVDRGVGGEIQLTDALQERANATGDGAGVVGPGHPAVFRHAGRTWIAYHGWRPARDGRPQARYRAMYIDRLDWADGRPVVRRHR